MKSFIAYLFALLMLASCANTESSIAKSNMYILNNSATISGFVDYDSRWTPNDSDCAKAMKASMIYLSRHKEISDSQHILSNISRYAVQFAGIIRNGEKIIICNYFPVCDEDREKYESSLILVLDGGFWYWRIEYKIKTNECEYLLINGYA